MNPHSNYPTVRSTTWYEINMTMPSMQEGKRVTASNTTDKKLTSVPSERDTRCVFCTVKKREMKERCNQLRAFLRRWHCSGTFQQSMESAAEGKWLVIGCNVPYSTYFYSVISTVNNAFFVNVEPIFHSAITCLIYFTYFLEISKLNVSRLNIPPRQYRRQWKQRIAISLGEISRLSSAMKSWV